MSDEFSYNDSASWNKSILDHFMGQSIQAFVANYFNQSHQFRYLYKACHVTQQTSWILSQPWLSFVANFILFGWQISYILFSDQLHTLFWWYVNQNYQILYNYRAILKTCFLTQVLVFAIILTFYHFLKTHFYHIPWQIYYCKCIPWYVGFMLLQYRR